MKVKRERTYAPYVKTEGKVKKKKRVIYSVPRLTLMGNQQKVTFKYSDFFSLNPALAGFASYVFCANGVYDPNITGVGHQPRGFDQLMALYDHFVVIHSKITATAMEATSTDKTNKWLALTLQDDSTPFAFSNDIFECRHTKWKPMYKDVPVGNLTMEFNNGFLGRSKPLSDPELKGSVSANPTETAFYIVYYGTDGGDDPGPVTCRVDIEYTVVLIEPKTPAGS